MTLEKMEEVKEAWHGTAILCDQRASEFRHHLKTPSQEDNESVWKQRAEACREEEGNLYDRIRPTPALGDK